ncbi:hypothetical protein PS467_00075 [Streptomyces luomodiensis]|uniref:Uncharacterized protein n=1 Tax=Streptomyces luomodiensis TaxID=3026192 RepID=A0ABY9UMX0_9ACTN|nr:hypothetical protein [Streptomyces sp. SCA4-21]WNE93853.1 hypothetical protein PS467_00075 [Streptomyces sp. SCA4-21]
MTSADRRAPDLPHGRPESHRAPLRPGRGTRHRDHDLVVFPEGAGIADLKRMIPRLIERTRHLLQGERHEDHHLYDRKIPIVATGLRVPGSCALPQTAPSDELGGYLWNAASCWRGF